MIVDLVTPSISRDAGGVAPAMANLAGELLNINSDYKFNLRCLNPMNDVIDVDSRIDINSYDRTFPKSIGMSKSLLLVASNSSANLIHTHGIWMATSKYQNTSYKKNNTPYIISPHGMLDPWILNRGKIKKNIARFLYEHYSWRNCYSFHALNLSEADSIRKIVPNSRVEIIPNGINIPVYEKKEYGSKKILFLGRFHEKKNVHNLINAVNGIDQCIYDNDKFVLILAGWGDEGYIATLKKLIAEGHPERFQWVGPIFGEDKERLFRKCHAFILPSFSEGMPMAILEALSFGLIVMMSRFCNLSSMIDHGLALDSGVGISSIQNCIIDFLKIDINKLSLMSTESYNFVESRYSWKVVAPSFDSFYKLAVEYGAK